MVRISGKDVVRIYGTDTFWPDDLALVSFEGLRWTSILGSRQITDAYLLALAVRNRGRFVTFDRAAPLDAVEGATAGHLVAL